ncbi:hypothetical protein SALGADO_50 [Arthrobacter phage Salgado]|uniref:Uncharacterized protein n=1 Tax=Arthrobacter phage Salgado TaxID=1772314 RepID=A0A0U4JU97_9CAUD|nr:hypothetical protein KMD22_gp50 [Arthrobacter phage Salgado]ALY10267.1 hypothetical protein SALGADO_50 [Arthrobacter phage Salgado]
MLSATEAHIWETRRPQPHPPTPPNPVFESRSLQGAHCDKVVAR